VCLALTLCNAFPVFHAASRTAPQKAARPHTVLPQITQINVLQQFAIANCSSGLMRERAALTSRALGPSMAGVMPPPYDNILYVHGPQRLFLPVLPLGGGASLGEVELKYDEAAAECVPDDAAMTSSLPGGVMSKGAIYSRLGTLPRREDCRCALLAIERVTWFVGASEDRGALQNMP
jgi:hypothetical protein